MASRNQPARRYFASAATRRRAVLGAVADQRTPVQAPGQADRQPVEPAVDVRQARRGAQNGRVRADTPWSTKPKEVE